MGSPLRLGIDLGGTKIELLALGEGGQEVWRKRVATPQGDYRATVQAIAALVHEAEQVLQRQGTLGVGIPGTESRATGLIKNANSTCLIGQPLRRDLETLLQREVRLANDANCFALSEAVDGAAAGAASVFGVILGTGVGGGIVVNGRVLEGVNGIAGEWGHNPLPGESPMMPATVRAELVEAQYPEASGFDKSALNPVEEHKANGAGGVASLGEGDALPFSPPLCYCGRRGCVETFLSGPGLAADHRRASGQTLTAEAVVAGAAAGDGACEASLQRYEARLARALAVVINILDPEVVVLGGGLSNIERLYRNVPRQWGSHIFSDTVATRLVQHRHGDSSGVRGAAWLWP